jgi:BCD family chlorophyll transporter-like MFS transporter
MTLSWVGIVRLGLVQMALGAVVVLMTSTLNRVMVVELALPAVLPGLLVGWHYGVQLSRPVWGHKSDAGGNRTLWVLLGMAMLAGGAVLAALGILGFGQSMALGLALSIAAYTVIGLGVGACGTSVLALLAAACAPRRRAAAATITWLMMIAGIALTAGVAGGFLDPYSPQRLLAVVAVVAAGAMVLSVLATWGLERGTPSAPPEARVPFRTALAEAWADPRARMFTVFVFLSMIAYFMQELILEPYGGLVFGMSPGETTQLSGAQHGGAFLGMLAVGVACTGLRVGALRAWVVGGCLASALALVAIAALGQTGTPLLTPAVVLLGLGNGIFAVAAIGAMMQLAGADGGGREGTRMGLWGAAQAMAGAFGAFLGAAAADALRLALPDAEAFGAVFVAEAGLFVASAWLAARIMDRGRQPAPALIPGA